MRNCASGNLEIPGSRFRAPRNDDHYSNGGSVVAARSTHVCHHPRRRMIQYPTERSLSREAAADWMPRLRGMTVCYSDSGSVAASSHSVVASSTCGRTAWRTRS